MPLKFKNPFKVNPNESSKYVKMCLDKAHKLCLEKKLKGINCAISKKNYSKIKTMVLQNF